MALCVLLYGIQKQANDLVSGTSLHKVLFAEANFVVNLCLLISFLERIDPLQVDKGALIKSTDLKNIVHRQLRISTR